MSEKGVYDKLVHNGVNNGFSWNLDTTEIFNTYSGWSDARIRVRLIFQMTLLILQSPLHLRLIKVLMMNQAVSTILIMIGDSLQQILSSLT